MPEFGNFFFYAAVIAIVCVFPRGLLRKGSVTCRWLRKHERVAAAAIGHGPLAAGRRSASSLIIAAPASRVTFCFPTIWRF